MLLLYLLNPRLPVLDTPSHDTLLIVHAALFDSIDLTAANNLAVRGPSQSLTGRALFDIDKAGRT
jgi:hypothetical protein